MSHCDFFTASHDYLIGYLRSSHAVFDMIGWGREVEHDLHVITS